MFEQLKKKMDVTLNEIVSRVLKKAADSNSFIKDEAEKTLIMMCKSCSESKVLHHVLNNNKSRSVGIKIGVALCLDTVRTSCNFSWCILMPIVSQIFLILLVC